MAFLLKHSHHSRNAPATTNFNHLFCCTHNHLFCCTHRLCRPPKQQESIKKVVGMTSGEKASAKKAKALEKCALTAR